MKRLLLAAAVLLLLLPVVSAGAEEARDISHACEIYTPSSKSQFSYLYDGGYRRQWESNRVLDATIRFMAPEGKPIAYLYVCFAQMPEKWEVQTSEDGKNWVTAVEGDTRFLHALVELPTPCRRVRLVSCPGERSVLSINEIRTFTEGTLPSWVQRWEPTHEKADIMFISTHPDDELLFFGGAIPTYAVEKECKTVVAYFTYSTKTRSSELLNGLWYMGVRNYPDIGTFPDSKTSNLNKAYDKLGGQHAVNEWMVDLYRRYQPEVVVTQDVDGEYGHTQHKIVVAAARDGIALAADKGSFPGKDAALDAWQVKKLYLHLWPENQIMFDWSVPLESMGGKTGDQLWEEAFLTCHKTQPSGLTRYGDTYDNRLFGLAYTNVGPDTLHNDFMENIHLPD